VKKPIQQIAPSKPSWLAIFHPNLTIGLLLIVIFLAFISILSAFGVYDSLINQNQSEAMQSGFRMLLYAIPTYGIMRMKRWARVFELMLSVFLVVLGGFIIAVYFLGTNENALLVMGVMIVLIHGTIAKYLFSDNCRQAFGLPLKKK
jgi:hypothetical protein